MPRYHRSTVDCVSFYSGIVNFSLIFDLKRHAMQVHTGSAICVLTLAFLVFDASAGENDFHGVIYSFLMNHSSSSSRIHGREARLGSRRSVIDTLPRNFD